LACALLQVCVDVTLGNYWWGSPDGTYDHTLHPMNKYWTRMCDVNSNPCCPKWGVLFPQGVCAAAGAPSALARWAGCMLG
jgi:hypothetical protein